jgi:hypothetical protein
MLNGATCVSFCPSVLSFLVQSDNAIVLGEEHPQNVGILTYRVQCLDRQVVAEQTMSFRDSESTRLSNASDEPFLREI